MSCNRAPIWGLRSHFYYCQTVAGLSIWGAVSEENTGLSFTDAARPRQRSHSRVPVPWDSRSYFTVSDFRLSYDFAGLRWRYSTLPIVGFSLYSLGSDYSTENIRCPAMDTCEPHRKHLLRHQLCCCVRVLRALPRDGSTVLLVEYLVRACLPRRSLAMSLHLTVTICILKKEHFVLCTRCSYCAMMKQ
jgi:hypothetical protein